MIRWLLLIAGLILASGADAQSIDARGAVEPKVGPEQDSPAVECGTDRECRLRVFEHWLNERRAAEAQHLQAVRAVEQAAIDKARRNTEPVRRHRRLAADLMGSTNPEMGFGGIFLGWGFNENLQVQLFGTEFNGTKSGATLASNGGYSLGARLKWIPFDWQVSPYVAGGVAFQSLSFGSSTVILNDVQSSSSSSQEGIVHVAHVAIGLDWQLRIGLHVGVEVAWQLPFYELVRDPQTGAQDDPSSGLLGSELRTSRFGGNFFCGWAWDL